MMSGMFAVDNLTVGAFASLPPANIQALLAKFNRVPAKRGQTIIQQGDAGDYYYLIESGRCKVSRLVAGSPVQLAELKEGDAFGEEALVADTVRNATVTMNTDGMLLRLSKQDFNDLLRAPVLQKVTGDEAERRVTAGATWIDVRFPAEYQGMATRARSTSRSTTYAKPGRARSGQGIHCLLPDGTSQFRRCIFAFPARTSCGPA
jgi:CRP-like cAMP-binding protein